MTLSRGVGRGDAARLLAAQRCGARTRKVTPCTAPAIRGRARCRMYGGAAGSRAPAGNRNAPKDGFHIAAARAERRAMNAFIRDMTDAIARLEAGCGQINGHLRPLRGLTPLGAWGCFAGFAGMSAARVPRVPFSSALTSTMHPRYKTGGISALWLVPSPVSH